MNSWKYVLIGGLLLAGCQKEELEETPSAAMMRVDGSWEITKAEVYNADAGTYYETDPDGRFTFEACNTKPTHFCPYTQESSYTVGGVTVTTSESGEHRFMEQGRVLELRRPRESGEYDVTHYEVLSRIGNMMRIRDVDENGTATVFVLVKE